MSLEIDITNFQSIENGNLKLVNGINTIIGESNSGKTAVIRALETLLRNTSGSNRYISWGKDKASVKLKYGDNLIEWDRNKKSSSYTVNGVNYSALGRSNVFSILEDNGFILDEKNKVANIEGEWDTMFPFGKTPAELFKCLENIFSVSNSDKILKSFKYREKGLTQDTKNIKERIDINELKIKTINNILDKFSVEDLKDTRVKLATLINKVEDLSNGYNKIKPLIYLNNLELVDIQDVVGISLIYDYKKVILDFKKVVKLLKLVKLDDPRVNTSKIENLSNYFQVILKDLSKLEYIFKLGKLTEVEINTISKDLSANYLKISDDLNKFKKLFKIVKQPEVKLNEIKSNLNEYVNLSKDLKKLAQVYKGLKSNKLKSETIEKELAEIEIDLSKFKTCPLCNSRLED